MLSDTAVAKQVIASVDEKKQKASEATGIAPEQFKGIHFELDVLRKQGLLIDLNITGTGIFSKTATWEDLGIADIPEDKRSSQFTKGQKILIPEDMIQEAEIC